MATALQPGTESSWQWSNRDGAGSCVFSPAGGSIAGSLRLQRGYRVAWVSVLSGGGVISGHFPALKAARLDPHRRVAARVVPHSPVPSDWGIMLSCLMYGEM